MAVTACQMEVQTDVTCLLQESHISKYKTTGNVNSSRANAKPYFPICLLINMRSFLFACLLGFLSAFSCCWPWEFAGIYVTDFLSINLIPTSLSLSPPPYVFYSVNLSWIMTIELQWWILFLYVLVEISSQMIQQMSINFIIIYSKVAKRTN